MEIFIESFVRMEFFIVGADELVRQKIWIFIKQEVSEFSILQQHERHWKYLKLDDDDERRLGESWGEHRLGFHSTLSVSGMFWTVLIILIIATIIIQFKL